MRYIVYTDGAFSQDVNIGGASFLIITETDFIGADSITLKAINSPTNTETVAIGLAAKCLLKSVHINEDDIIEFHTDSQFTMDFYLKHLKPGVTDFYSRNSRVIESIKRIRKLSRIATVEFEKVKAHKDKLNPNMVVDRLAKIAIRRD